MILRRSKDDPGAALSDLTRDLGRIRTDLDNVRLALAARGRAVLRDASERMAESTTRTKQQTATYAREHPGVISGIAIGVAGLVGLLGLASYKGMCRR